MSKTSDLELKPPALEPKPVEQTWIVYHLKGDKIVTAEKLWTNGRGTLFFERGGEEIARFNHYGYTGYQLLSK